MRRWEMATRRLSIKDDETSGVQLRCARQGTIGDSSSTQGVEEICGRKSTQDTNLDRPQKLSPLYDNEGATRTTNSMQRDLESIGHQLGIPARKGRRETACPHLMVEGQTGTRRRTNYSKKENNANTRTI